MTAAVFVFAAADWVTGTYLLTTAWQGRRLRRSGRRAQLVGTPLADEVEEWLAQQE